jgi:type VI secretion system secreted protein VgrG
MNPMPPLFAACSGAAASPVLPGSARQRECRRTPVHSLLLFDDASRLAQNAGTVRYHREDATEEDTVTAWNAVRRLQPESPSATAGTMATRTVRISCHASHGGGGPGRQWQRLAASRRLHRGNAAGREAVTTHRRALAMARHDMEIKCFQGESCVRDLRGSMVQSARTCDRRPRQPSASSCLRP